MKQNNHNRQNRRFNNTSRGNRPAQTIYRNTCLDSSGPAGKLRGTPLQLNEKYVALAKDAFTANDMILAEQYRQYADHYMRLQNIAIENENMLRAQKEAQQAAQIAAQEVSEEPEQIISDTDSLSGPEIPTGQKEVIDEESASETDQNNDPNLVTG